MRFMSSWSFLDARQNTFFFLVQHSIRNFTSVEPKKSFSGDHLEMLFSSSWSFLDGRQKTKFWVPKCGFNENNRKHDIAYNSQTIRVPKKFFGMHS